MYRNPCEQKLANNPFGSFTLESKKLCRSRASHVEISIFHAFHAFHALGPFSTTWPCHQYYILTE